MLTDVYLHTRVVILYNENFPENFKVCEPSNKTKIYGQRKVAGKSYEVLSTKMFHLLANPVTPSGVLYFPLSVCNWCKNSALVGCTVTACPPYYVPTGKDYPIQASTRDEMLVWVKAIEDAKVSQL